jgi:hypothetical protein
MVASKMIDEVEILYTKLDEMSIPGAPKFTFDGHKNNFHAALDNA